MSYEMKCLECKCNRNLTLNVLLFVYLLCLFVCLFGFCNLQLRRVSSGSFPVRTAAASRRAGAATGTMTAVTSQTSLCGAVSHCFPKIFISR